MSIYKVNRHLVGDFVLSPHDKVYRFLVLWGFYFLRGQEA